MHKGQMVCEGSGTSLKAQYGESYEIRQDSTTVEDDTMVWRASNSAEATRKLLELEDATEDETYKVDFPTLEQVFLKVTSNSNTVVQDVGGDGIAGEGERITTIDEKIFSLDTLDPDTLELDVARPIGIARQIAVLFQKRYILLLQRSNYIAYGINLLIPIIVAAALSKFLHKWMPLQTCTMNEALLRTASANEVPNPLRPQAYPALAPLEPYSRTTIFGGVSAVVGPPAAFSGTVQDDLYISAM